MARDSNDNPSKELPQQALVGYVPNVVDSIAVKKRRFDSLATLIQLDHTCGAVSYINNELIFSHNKSETSYNLTSKYLNNIATISYSCIDTQAKDKLLEAERDIKKEYIAYLSNIDKESNKGNFLQIQQKQLKSALKKSTDSLCSAYLDPTDEKAFDLGVAEAIRNSQMSFHLSKGKHAETEIIDTLLPKALSSISQQSEQQVMYVGISKKCCPNCHAAIKALNNVIGQKLQIEIRESGFNQNHNTHFPSTVPNFLKANNENILSQYTNIFGNDVTTRVRNSFLIFRYTNGIPQNINVEETYYASKIEVNYGSISQARSASTSPPRPITYSIEKRRKELDDVSKLSQGVPYFNTSTISASSSSFQDFKPPAIFPENSPSPMPPSMVSSSIVIQDLTQNTNINTKRKIPSAEIPGADNTDSESKAVYIEQPDQIKKAKIAQGVTIHDEKINQDANDRDDNAPSEMCTQKMETQKNSSITSAESSTQSIDSTNYYDHAKNIRETLIQRQADNNASKLDTPDASCDLSSKISILPLQPDEKTVRKI